MPWGAHRPALLAEALATLALASLLIALAPFRRIAALAAWGKQGRAATPVEARAVAAAVRAWAARVPWRTVCFQQGLAAQMMLRRRGLAARLHYGACHLDGRLVAHVWVTSGATEVIGCEGAGDYGLLASFPPADFSAA